MSILWRCVEKTFSLRFLPLESFFLSQVSINNSNSSFRGILPCSSQVSSRVSTSPSDHDRYNSNISSQRYEILPSFLSKRRERFLTTAPFSIQFNTTKSNPATDPNHPVYPDGEVCISILHPPEDDQYGYEPVSERWSPVQTPETILLSVISMLSGPNEESPANVEAAKMLRENEKEFRSRCRRDVRRSLEDD